MVGVTILGTLALGAETCNEGIVMEMSATKLPR
jgi:hypothetical protein